MKKNVFAYIAGGLVFAIGIGVGIYFLVKNNISTDAQTYVSLSVNPTVEFTVNENDQVISMVATDEEGDQIIQSYDFYGMNIEDACEKFTELD